MATVQVQSVLTASAQSRTPRVATTWAPPSAVMMHTRPWRSSPLAGPGFSTLPTIISESSEESHENDFGDNSSAWGGAPTRSPSVSSIEAGSVTASASGYGSRNTSVSSLSLFANTSANGTVTSSSQSHAARPARLTKSMRRPPSEVLVTAPPRARTLTHARPRPVSMPVTPPSSLIPHAYSRASPSPSDVNIDKQPPSQSRDPSSDWMSTSPFGPGMTPKFSRLAMASPAVVMPLSAREFRKRKARESQGKGKERETPLSSNHVTFSDNPLSASRFANGVPQVKVSPPPSEDVHQARFSPSTSGTQPHFDHSHPKPSPHATPSTQPQPQPRSSSPKRKRPRSRPNTPPRQFPPHPLISPKSSASTFFSFASTSDEVTPLPSHLQGTVVLSPPALADDPGTADVVPPPRPRPRLRRKSHPDHIPNGARLSLLEAMNRLSQESTSIHRLSGIDGANRLSVASQASGQTLFYDIVQSDGDSQAVGGGVNGTSALHTQSLNDLSSTLARTGIEAVPRDDDVNSGVLSDSGRKGRRNVRTVRISDTVEVSHPPVLRPRKLTKTRPGSARGSVPGTGLAKETKAQTRTQPHERRASLLPWKFKGSSNNTSGLVGVGNTARKSGEITRSSTSTKSSVQSNAAAAASVSRSSTPIGNGTTHVQRHSKLIPNCSPNKVTVPVWSTPMTTPEPDFESSFSTLPRKSRRYTFSLFAFPRHKREKSNTLDLGSEHNSKHKHTASVGSLGCGTDGTSMSIRTITQGSQSTLTEPYDLTTLASSGSLSGSRRAVVSSTVPMLRRLNAQEMATPGAHLHRELDDQGGSTPTLITNGSTATSSSVPRTLTPPSFVRSIGGSASGGPFIPRPSGLKESFTDTSEEDSDGMSGVGVKPRLCVHQRLQSPLARASVGIDGTVTSEDEQVQLCPTSNPNPHPGSRPGTANSSLTTATEISYVSLSTADAVSTASSRSTSPSPVVGDKWHRRMSVSHGDGEVHPCALCGHLVPRLVSPPSSPPSSPTPERPEMHPMFTVPLVTVPASAVSLVETRSFGPNVHLGGRGMNAEIDRKMGARYGVKRSSKDHATAPVPVTVVPNGCSPGPVTSTFTKQRHRPQTAPAGTGDARLKFVEDALALRTREGSIDNHARGEVRDHSKNSRVGRSGSKFKTMLKGLLKWNV